MHQLFARSFLAACSLLMLGTSSGRAAVPSETLLPASTKAVLLIGDIKRLEDNWDKCQIGQLANDPVMQPFVDDLREQLKRNGNGRLQKLGLTLDDLRGVPAGEVAIAITQPKAGEGATVMLIDVTGQPDVAKELLAKMGRNLTAQGATRVARPTNAGQIVYRHKANEERRTAAHFHKGDLIAISDDERVLAAIQAGQATPRKDSLAAFAPFAYCMKRVASESGELQPDLRWFIEPFGYIETSRAINPPAAKTKRKGPDKLKVFRDQGFSAIQGVGGYVHFAPGRYDILHRTAIYAPPVKGRDPQAKNKYELAARMLRFPNGGDLAPRDWVPRELATCVTMNWDLQTAFDASETLVDAMVGTRGVFRDVLDQLRTDVEGPQVDIRKDIVGNLGTRVTILSDYQLPIDVKSERTLFAAEVVDVAAVSKGIEKLFGGDPDVIKREFNGHIIWEITDAPKQAALPMVKIEPVGFAPIEHDEGPVADEEEEKGRRALRNAAITVAEGHLFVASHVDFLKKVLSRSPGQEQVGESVDYRIVNEELDQLGAGKPAIRIFTRTDEAYRPTYELIRMGKMPQSETLLGKLLNGISGEGKEGEVRKQRIDGKNLPDFDVARRYLGPGGAYITTEDNGWIAVGFTLSKDLKRSPK